MKCYDVRCPICNTLNRRLVLEETQGWMECEHCQQVVKVLAIYKPAEEVHHIVPLNDGGTHARSNLVSLCRSCHMKAHALLGTRTPHKE